MMKPRKGSNVIYPPITFDYTSGRRNSRKNKIVASCIVGVIGLIFGLGLLSSKEGNFLTNTLTGFLALFATTVIIRFPILGEHKIRNSMLEAKERDYKKTFRDVWGIFAIDDVYPYYVHFRNGRTGIFVRFDKDVILGKVSDSKYEHFEAISDAYNLVASLGIGMCQIDYMDVIGNDPRLDSCFQSLTEIKNPDMRDLMTDIYSNLQDNMNEKVTTFDVYVFTFKSSESSFWYQIQKVFSCMLDANYASYKLLNAEDLRGLSISLNNLLDFSVVDAMSQAFDLDSNSYVIPIKSRTNGVEKVLNKTVAEKKEEAKLKAKEQELRKGTSKKKKKGVSQDDEIDIFE